MHNQFEAEQEQQIVTLLDALSIEEQVALLAGADFWTTVPIPRLGVPALKVTDGPAGARGGGPLVGGKRTAAFPVGIALGASWNVDLLRQVGRLLAREAQDKGAGVVLGPTVNLFRHALNGRNFESYSEDPYLTGMLAVAYIQGLQEHGVAATVKHFAGNESEYQRGTINSVIPVRALRELYLRPFEMAVSEGRSWAVMSAYNRLDGIFCGEHPWLLTRLLRDEWGFDGVVMSDWGGTHSAGASVVAGLDLEMPGPARARAGLLAEAEANPEVRAAVRTAALRILRLMARTETLTKPRDVALEAELEHEYPDTRLLIRQAGAEGLVLLQHHNQVLPLPASATVAVIGPNAAVGQVMGGGSAQMNAHRRVSPLEGLQAALGEAQVRYAPGCDNDKLLPIFSGELEIGYYAGDDPVRLFYEVRPFGEVMWFHPPAGVPASFRARLTATLPIAAAGSYDLGLASAGLSRLWLDDQLLIDNWEQFTPGDTYFGLGSAEQRARCELAAGQHRLLIEFTPCAVDVGIAGLSALRLGFRQPLPESSIEDAARLAAQTEYAVVCIGTNGDWETEGQDRWGLSLPGRQDELVRAVAAANPKTIVVLQTGGPVLMPWLDQVPAVLQAWFPGQEAGHAIADVLCGIADPAGRLPQTFPARLEDDPTHPEHPDRQYPGEAGEVVYSEGLYSGYRHVDRAGLTPLFPFGFGLSYTTFALGTPRLSSTTLAPHDQITVTVPVTNTGTRSGQTVVQLYIHDPESRLERPEKELKGFAKVSLAPGATEMVTMNVNMRALAYFDDQRMAWVAEAGRFALRIGTSSVDLPHTCWVQLTDDWSQ